MKVAKHDLDAVAKSVIFLGREKVGAHVVALYGNLGAGKTTLAQSIARMLGVSESVASPTFVLMKKYVTNDAQYKTLVHVDAYRITHDKESEQLRLSELLGDKHTLILIEWPEHLKSVLPPDTNKITLAYVDDEHRDILGV